jgi:Winged helix DNA-binding domain
LTLLTLRALNRATLARQLLLERSSMAALDAIEHLVGLQAQAPLAPYYGLWSRLEGFTGKELSTLLTDRKAVRIVLMRGTIHLVTAADCYRLRPLLQPMLEHALRMNTTYRKDLGGVEFSTLADDATRILKDGPLTPRELGTRLAERWSTCPPNTLAVAARSLLPLVQVPPRALWQRSGQVRLTTAADWLGRPTRKPLTIDDLVLRYLAAFGPASTADVQTWSGLKGLAEVIDRLAPRPVCFKDERGQTLYDLPDAPRPDPDTPAPVRLIAPFDNILLSHADRTRIVSDERRKTLFFSKNGVFPGTVLVDGWVAGSWELIGKGDGTSIRVEPYTKFTSGAVDAITAEGGRLLNRAFGVDDPRVVIAR